MRISVNRASEFFNISPKCVFTSEFDEKCVETYTENFLDEKIYGDITKLKDKDIKQTIPKHHLLLAGFPCQPFSLAGHKLGFKDTRGTLFHDIYRIIKVTHPDLILLENVKNLKSHDNGKTLKVIMTLLNEYYYMPEPAVLNARNFGLPQNRERIFIVGFKKKKRKKEFIYSVGHNKPTCIKDALEKNVGEEYTISNRLWDGHQKRKIKNKKNGRGFGYKLHKPNDPYTRTISARYYKDGSDALIYQDNSNPRKLTPRECANLQGFPRNFKINKSKKNAYKQFGNSVPINVVEALLKSMIKYYYF